MNGRRFAQTDGAWLGAMPWLALLLTLLLALALALCSRPERPPGPEGYLIPLAATTQPHRGGTTPAPGSGAP